MPPARALDGGDQPAARARDQRRAARPRDRLRHLDRAALDAARDEGGQDLQHDGRTGHRPGLYHAAPGREEVAWNERAGWIAATG